MSAQLAMMAESMSIGSESDAAPEPAPNHHVNPYGDHGAGRGQSYAQQASNQAPQQGFGRPAGITRKEGGISQLNQGASPYARPAASAERRSIASATAAAEMAPPSAQGNSLRSLRDRLMRNQ